jgi:hypothetical protein
MICSSPNLLPFDHPSSSANGKKEPVPPMCVQRMAKVDWTPSLEFGNAASWWQAKTET